MDQYADGDYHIDQLLEVLCNHRRRVFIRYLADHEIVELSEIAQTIAEIEHCSQKSAYTSLYQTHTDKLLRAKIIEHHNGAKTYERGCNYPVARDLLEYCDNL